MYDVNVYNGKTGEKVASGTFKTHSQARRFQARWWACSSGMRIEIVKK